MGTSSCRRDPGGAGGGTGQPMNGPRWLFADESWDLRPTRRRPTTPVAPFAVVPELAVRFVLPLHTLLINSSIIELMVRISNDTLAPSQTLDRGLLCLELIAGADRALSVESTAATLGLHRSIVYRLLRTLERRHLVERNEEGEYVPGPYLAVLSRGVRRNLRSAATPSLADLCAELQMTAFLVVADGEEAVTIDSVEPTSLDAHVAYRPGTRHPIDRGAPGIALLAGRPARSGERKEVIAARARGWAESEAEVIAGMASIAAPIADEGAIAVLWLAGNPVDGEEVAAHVVLAAADIARRLTP